MSVYKHAQSGTQSALILFPESVMPISQGPEVTPATGNITNEFMQNLARSAKAASKSDERFLKIQGALSSILSSKIAVYVDELGGKTFLKVRGANLFAPTSLDRVVIEASKRMEDYDLFLKHKELEEHVNTWSDKIDGLTELPSSFSLDPKEPTFNRINIAPEEGPTPTWNNFVARCGENGQALMAFVWSILEKNDKCQQFLLLKGDGDDGKGSFIRWLGKLFNDQVVGLNVKNPLWLAQCVGKRVAAFNDINATSVVMSSEFKQVTGGDKVTVQQKYEKAVSLTLDTKFILTTNRSVNIINEDAMRRRAILIEMSPKTELIDDYEEKLEQEGPAFLFKCKKAYEKLYDKKARKVMCDYSFFESAASLFEEPYEAIFEKCFTLDANSCLSAADFACRVMEEFGSKDNNKVGAFKEWMSRTHGIKRKRNDNGKGIYSGIKIKPRY